jgi:hypothetical protein
MPDDAKVQRLVETGRPALAKLLAESRPLVDVVATGAIPNRDLEITLIDIGDLVTQYQDSDEAASDDSDCTRGCQENFQTCLAEWVQIAGGEGLDLEEDELEQDPGSVGGIDDNPLDVENNDPGDTGAEDEDDEDDGATIGGTILAGIGGALCGIELAACLAACIIPG